MVNDIDMTSGESEFVDRMGLFFEMMGAPRTMGRIFGWLMICDPPHQSLNQLASALRLSKPSISNAIRPMQEGGMVERLPSATRQHHYQVMPGGFARVLRLQMGRLSAGVEAAEVGLSALPENRRDQRERLEDLRDFCAFTEQELGDEFLRRWEHYRATNRREA